MEDEFAGFTPPTSDYYKTPNEWIDISAKIDNLAELKIVQYVMRHTWGFQEYGKLKKITIDEFAHGRKRQDGSRMDSGTGLGLTAVKSGIKKATEHGYIVAHKDEDNKGGANKSYALKLRKDISPASRNPTRVNTQPSRNATNPGRNQANPWSQSDQNQARKGGTYLETHPKKETFTPPSEITTSKPRSKPTIAFFMKNYCHNCEIYDKEAIATSIDQVDNLWRISGLPLKDFEVYLKDAESTVGHPDAETFIAYLERSLGIQQGEVLHVY